MRRPSIPAVPITLLLALIAVPVLSGCLTGDDAQDGVPFASYEEARDAQGTVLESESDSSVRLKLLEPETEGVTTGELEILVLLFDPEADTPVTDADFGEDQPDCGSSHGFCAEMRDMGHGTSPEQAPQAVDYGLYRGMTTISMSGNWTLHFRPQVDSQIVEYSTTLRATE